MYLYNSAYQSRIATTLEKAIQAHTRITAIRVDLRLPNDFIDPLKSNAIITRFFESLKAKIAADLNRKEQDWKRSLTCCLKYTWVREFGSINGKKHFHAFLFVNKDVYHSLGDFNAREGNLSAMIRQAWCSALELPFPEYQRLVHFPFAGVIYMEVNNPRFQQQKEQVLGRANYLAKEATKYSGDGERSFGCSR